jgi:Arc/MetJ-type ribon-helix-helix transcriptional regulator
VTGCNRAVTDTRKRAVSVRLGTADIRKIKKLAQSLGARDTDVIRYAIKAMLARLAPLHEGSARGRELLPVFVEMGADLLQHFDLDAARLEAIINAGAPRGLRVANEDIELIAMSVLQQRYALLRLGALGREARDETRLPASLRSYLYEKYVYRHAAPAASATSEDSERAL